MSLKQFPVVIDSNLYVKTWKDILYNQLNDYMSGTGIYKDLTDSAKVNRQIGRSERAFDKYEELFYYKILIDYIINAKQAISISGLEDVQAEIDSFKFDKIRSNILCRFNTSKLFDDLIRIAGINSNILDGLDYMIFDPSISTLSSEMVVNGQFITDSVWSKGVNWIISPASGGDSAGEHNPSSLGYLVQDIGIERLSTYDVSFEIAGYGSGTNNMYLGDIGSTSFINITGIGIYTATLTTDNIIGGSQIFFESDNSLAIKNVSVKKHIQVSISNGNDFIIQ